jgi:hypothetical protein
MNTVQLLIGLAILPGTLGFGARPLPAQETPQRPASVIVLERSDGYCHLKFPAIREETLSSAQPALKDAESEDIIDFYGPCDHDPTGKDEIQAQQIQTRRKRYGILGE